MNILRLAISVFLIGLMVPMGLTAAQMPVGPVTPGATPEARALLKLLYEISGKYILTGQHNYPNIRDRNTQFAANYIGKTPAVFSTDFGHARDGDTDSYLARPDIVQECIRQHQLGALITICWHAVPPTADEPVTFSRPPDTDPKALRSVQGQLLDEQFKDLLTPGTAIYNKWCEQVDAIAVYLKQLQDANVPVLWRPYHEMNGDWFWWGGRTGEYSTLKLYQQIFDRLVKHHQLKNLVWIWSVDRVNRPAMAHDKYFPGLEYMDVLGLDVYRNDFGEAYYESLVKLSEGKPLTLAEVGNPPSLEILSKQPRWTFFVTWAGMVRNATKKQYVELINDPRVLSLEDPSYASVGAAYRQALNLPPIATKVRPANFSGQWILNEEKSQLGRTVTGATAPAKLETIHNGHALTVRTTHILEYADDRITEEKLTLDGAEVKSELMNSSRVVTATVSPGGGNEIVMNSTTVLTWGAPGAQIVARETWKLLSGGNELSIHRSSHGPGGPAEVTFIFDRR